VQRYGNELPASNGPRFWGFVTGGTTPAALIGDWLVSTYDLNLTSVANSTAPNIELEAIHLMRELFNLPSSFHGTFVTGATMSNFAGLAMAREWVARQFNKSIADEGLQAIPSFKVLSGEAHIATAKAVRTQSARHPQSHLVNNQSERVVCGFDSLTKTSIAQSC
jgi:glutamate/tyrosine decarboxylase-like PLP-dependent enzyme